MCECFGGFLWAVGALGDVSFKGADGIPAVSAVAVCVVCVFSE